jgi:hypothetical protein
MVTLHQDLIAEALWKDLHKVIMTILKHRIQNQLILPKLFLLKMPLFTYWKIWMIGFYLKKWMLILLFS